MGSARRGRGHRPSNSQKLRSPLSLRCDALCTVPGSWRLLCPILSLCHSLRRASPTLSALDGSSSHLRRQITLLEQRVIGLFIDMVEGEWIKSTNEIKAVLLFCEHAGHITGVHKAKERQQDLGGAV